MWTDNDGNRVDLDELEVERRRGNRVTESEREKKKREWGIIDVSGGGGNCGQAQRQIKRCYIRKLRYSWRQKTI